MLKVARELLGMSQDELADELGLERRAVQRAEAHNPSLSLERQELFTTYFQTRGLEFLGPGEDNSRWGIAELVDRGENSVPSRFIRAARMGLSKSQEAMGVDAELGTVTIRRIEATDETVKRETRLYLIEHMKKAGVTFTPPNGVRGWQLAFAVKETDSAVRHPRFNLQKRKRSAPRG